MQKTFETGGSVKKVMTTLDTDLPLLAAKAALELDRLKSGSNGGLDSVNELARLIKNSIDVSQGTQPKPLMDPATITVVGQAFSISHEDEPLVSTCSNRRPVLSALSH